MKRSMLFTTVLMVILLLTIPACDDARIMNPDPAESNDGVGTSLEIPGSGVVVKHITSVGEAFPCFVGPEPEDFRMQGFADITLDGEEYTVLVTITLLQPITPDHSQGAQVSNTLHLFQVFPEGFELPEPVFLDACLDYEYIVGEPAEDVMNTQDRSVIVPGTEPLVFKLNALLSPQDGSGIFEGVRSSPPITTTNGLIEFDFIPEIGDVIPVRAEWEVDAMIAFN